MPGVRPPGMDRPDTNLNYQIKKEAEPMTENTRPELHESESETEQWMRADFMHAESCMDRPLQDYDPADEVDYAEYASRWLDRDNRWMPEWLYLTDATQRWRDDPTAAETNMVQRVGVMSAIERRSEDQARYIATHGIQRDEHGLLTSHYVTRVEDRELEDIAQADQESLARAFFASQPDEGQQHVEPRTRWANAAEISTGAPVPVSSAFAAARTRELAGTSTVSPSPLANYQPGNALAASLANAERDGVER